MKNKFVTVAAAVSLAAVLVAGCSGPKDTPGAEPLAASATTARPADCGSCDGSPQADHTGSPVLDLDAAAVDAAKATANEVMAAYTATKPKGEWFAALAPLITTEYAQEAQYIEPSRLPVKKLVSGPVVGAEVSTGYQVRAKYETNAGPWVVILTRVSDSAPWLASNVLPAAEANQ